MTPGGPVDEVEAALLVKDLAADGINVDEHTVVRILNMHGLYVDGKIREAQAAAEAARVETLRQSAIQAAAAASAAPAASAASVVPAPAAGAPGRDADAI